MKYKRIQIKKIPKKKNQLQMWQRLGLIKAMQVSTLGTPLGTLGTLGTLGKAGGGGQNSWKYKYNPFSNTNTKQHIFLNTLD